jgi:hypothetical protein
VKKNTVHKYSKNFLIIERYFKDKDQYGYAEMYEDGSIVISVRKNMSDVKKVKAFAHELSHINQFIAENSTEAKSTQKKKEQLAEKVARGNERLISWVIKNIDWYARGVAKSKKGEGNSV